MGQRHLTRSVLLAASLLASRAEAVPFAERSAAARVAYTTVAALANVVPVVSTLYAPRCLPGYVVCKLLFAGGSLVAVTEQLVTSGGADWRQTRAILQRGFGGDWVLTGAHVAGDRTPEPWPEPRSTASETGSGWQPPPP